MSLDLLVAAPGFTLRRRLAEGAAPLVLGRDAECGVCLRDPERKVSRRHLAVWNEGGVLHFQVLSAVGGVVLQGLEIAPGARGVLRADEALALSAYRLTVEAVPDPAAAAPGDLLERGAASHPAAAPVHDDPSGDRAFGSTFGPGAPGVALDADALLPASDLQPFLRGLGLEDRRAYTRGELETLGRATRLALVGLLRAVRSASGEAAQQGSPPAAREAHPSQTDVPVEARLQALFASGPAQPGYLPPDRAIAGLVTELLAQQAALRTGMRAALEAALREFEPQAMRERLLGGGGRWFESARAWDAFVRHYAQREQDLPAWVSELLERHWAEAHARELQRARQAAAAHGR